MKITDIQVIGQPLVLAAAADVDSLEARLWIRFPAGYADYVTRLGEGVLGGSFIRIYPPWRIEKELPDWRRRINKHWFWEDGRDLLPKERAVECVIIGDTVNGDELVFHPTRPDRLFVLPADAEQVFEAGSDLLSAIEWICTSGELIEPFDERNFEPFDSRKEAVRSEGTDEVVDPEGESLDDILELGRRWAKRHGARKLAQKDLKSQTKPGQKSKLLYESFVIDAKSALDCGYAASWSIIDAGSGLEVAVFRWTKDADSYGSSYEPNHANVAKLRDAAPKG